MLFSSLEVEGGKRVRPERKVEIWNLDDY